jgi:2-polyprenyl-3-methyl-5-hydroxy-6-metoxy-1,4-benzoquinol methylase
MPHPHTQGQPTMESFSGVKRRFKSALRKIVKKHSSYEVDEAALPAYAHANPLIDYIFWQRVRVAYDYALSHDVANVLDFGCGTGLMSYALAQAGKTVVAVDVNFGPLALVKEQISFPPSITFVEGEFLRTELPTQRFDLILALDVLEHITDLQPYIERFSSLLTPLGSILVSGPSENRLYKLGRSLAGSRFTGDYHVSDITTIKNEFSRHLKTETVATLIWPVTLFELFSARPFAATHGHAPGPTPNS